MKQAIIPQARLTVRLTPRSSRSQIAGWDGSVLTVRVKAPPVDGKANGELIELLADELNLPKSQISVRSGHSSRSKVIEFNGITQVELESRLMKHSTMIRTADASLSSDITEPHIG
jgi:uncharacterized protein (TIGR00251 family)